MVLEYEFQAADYKTARLGPTKLAPTVVLGIYGGPQPGVGVLRPYVTFSGPSHMNLTTTP